MRTVRPRPATAKPIRESNAIAIQFDVSPPITDRLASLEEKALLAYQAMSNSDDIVLIVERGTGVQADDAIVIGVNDAFCRASGYSNDQILGHTVAALFSSEEDAKT